MHVSIDLLFGSFETDRLRRYLARIAAKDGVSVDIARDRMIASNPMLRFGRPEQFGAFCAFIASEQAGDMAGQNCMIDGGEYLAVF